jgi:hypothetical protein
MKQVILYIVIVLAIGCKVEKKMTVSKFYPFKKLSDTSVSLNQVLISKEGYFLIHGYSFGAKTDKFIDSFIRRDIDTSDLKCTTYYAHFFKETSQTNLQKIKENPRIIDRYSFDHDLVYVYLWESGKFISVEKFLNGKKLGPKQKQPKVEINSML